jgi:hypothetical protein
MMRKVALLILVALALWPSSSFAQASAAPGAAPAAPRSATANGVTVLAIQPAPTAPQGATPETSLLWLYNANSNEVLLCTSHTDGGFGCTAGVKLGW